MTNATAQELAARLMQHVEDTMCDADVDFPAGHRAGARVSYDSDSLQTYFESELADALAREAALRRVTTEALIKVENDRTLWDGEWNVWAIDARSALSDAQ